MSVVDKVLFDWSDWPLEVVSGVLHDGRVAVGLVPAVGHVHVELPRPRHEAVPDVLRHRLVFVQFSQKHALVEPVYILNVAEYKLLLYVSNNSL